MQSYSSGGMWLTANNLVPAMCHRIKLGTYYNAPTKHTRMA